VVITSPNTGDTLLFDAASGTWVNRPTAARKAKFAESIDGVRTTFTMDISASSGNNLLISLGGVIQEPGVDFSFTAPRTVNFAAPPPPGLEHWILVEGVPSSASGTSGGGGGGTGGATLPTGTAANEFLRWNNGLATWTPSVAKLAEANDVALTTPTAGDFLQLAAGSRWVNVSTLDEGTWT